MKLTGSAASLNDFATGEKYGLYNNYLQQSYMLDSVKASALFDSVRYAREKYLEEFISEKDAPDVFKKLHKEQIYHSWCNDYLNYMTYHNYYAHDVFSYLTADLLPFNLKDSLRFNSKYNYGVAYHQFLKSFVEMRFHETTGHMNDSLKYEFTMRNFFDPIESEFSGIDKEIAYEAFAGELAFRMRDINQELYFKTIAPVASVMSFSKYDYLEYSFMTQYNALKRITQGKPAPNFTLKNIEDKEVSLSDFKGKIVSLNFWGTWCWPCIASVPQHIELHKKYLNQDIVFLNVALEYSEEDIARWKSYVKEKSYTGVHVVADKQFHNKQLVDYMLNSAPTYMIIGRQGEIIETRAIPPYANTQVIDRLLEK